MQIEFLGTGGAITIPQPLCSCDVCSEARRKGRPYSRSGPSLFVHGPDVLIDTPEEIKQQINRSQIKQITACFYSHWHPDHVMGRRLWEMNMDWRNWPAQHERTDIYMPARVASDFQQFLGTWDHLKFFEEKGVVSLHKVAEGGSVEVGGVAITPIPLAAEYVFAFLFEGDGKRFLIAPDELVGWQPSPDLGQLDLVVVPKGINDVNPLTGEQTMPSDHPVLEVEATFHETLDILKSIAAERVLMTHIEEPDHLGYDDLIEMEESLSSDGWNIRFAFDGMVVPV